MEYVLMKKTKSILASILIGLCLDTAFAATSTTNLKQYMSLAAQGNADAQYGLGLLYFKGEGVPKNDALAVKWFRKAADQGNADAQSFLGFLYYKGQGIPQNYATAAEWFRKAAVQGNAEAKNFLDELN